MNVIRLPNFTDRNRGRMDHSHHPSQAFATPTLDHTLLIAGAAVRQAGTHTAALAERIRLPQAPGDTRTALVAIFAGEDFRAAAWLRSSFHPGVAQAVASKARSNFMKAGLTLAF